MVNRRKVTMRWLLPLFVSWPAGAIDFATNRAEFCYLDIKRVWELIQTGKALASSTEKIDKELAAHHEAARRKREADLVATQKEIRAGLKDHHRDLTRRLAQRMAYFKEASPVLSKLSADIKNDREQFSKEVYANRKASRVLIGLLSDYKLNATEFELLRETVAEHGKWQEKIIAFEKALIDPKVLPLTFSLHDPRITQETYGLVLKKASKKLDQELKPLPDSLLHDMYYHLEIYAELKHANAIPPPFRMMLDDFELFAEEFRSNPKFPRERLFDAPDFIKVVDLLAKFHKARQQP